MQLPFFFIVGVGTLALAMTHGFRTALRLVYLPILLLAPVWLREESLSSVVIDLRLVAACGILPALILALFRKRQKILLADIAVVALLGVIFISMNLAGEIRLLTFFELVRMFVLPYVMGRWFFASDEDLDRTLPLLAAICLLIGVWSVFEAVTHINPVLKLPMAPTFWRLEGGSEEGFRWGLKRSQGPQGHPIHWGLAMVMILPWAMAAAQRVRTNRGPTWWWLAPGAMLAAILVTVSRGAWIAALVALGAGIVLRFTRFRVPILVVSLVVGTALWTSKDALIPMLTALIKSKQEAEEVTMIEIAGNEYQYDGDRHRTLLSIVYREFVEQTGWFGYGADIEDTVIGRIDDESARHLFRSIDNHYLQFRLMHGNLGLALFLVLQACALVYFLQASWDVRTAHSMLAGALFGAMAGLALVLWSVWLAEDFAAVWLFSVGLASNFRAGLEGNSRLPEKPPGRPDQPSRPESPKLNVLKPQRGPGNVLRNNRNHKA